MVAIGIDLGTTNSCVAAFHNGTLRVIEDDRGLRVIPSTVTYTEEKTLVGFETFTHPDSTVYEIKRLIGERFDEENVQKHISSVTYKVINKNNGPHVSITLNNKVKLLSPEEVCAEVLKHLKQIAEKRLDASVTDAVITVPAYFSGSRRSSTKRAAELAGFEKIRIINEPTAAALSFQCDCKNEKTRIVLVFDFGGGTFDVTIARASKNSFVVLAIDGDCSLGGTDMDANLMKLLRKSIKNDTGRDVKEKYLSRLKKICNEAKERLSMLSETDVDLMGVCSQEDYFVKVTKRELDALNMGLFQKTMDIVLNCVSAAKLRPADVDEILLVGGSTRIPKVQEMLRTLFGSAKFNSTTNPDEDVARGAAIYAANLSGFNFTDVLSLSLGIETHGDVMEVIIPRNTQIPYEDSTIVSTPFHNLTSLTFNVYQGESLVSKKNHFLYSFVMKNITKAMRGVVKISVTFKVDVEGILTVIAHELNANNKVKLKIEITNSETNEVTTGIENLLLSKEDEIYVDFAQKKIALEKFCDDLKLYCKTLERSSEADIHNKIDSVLLKMNDIKMGDDARLEKLSSELSAFISSKVRDVNTRVNTASPSSKSPLKRLKSTFFKRK